MSDAPLSSGVAPLNSFFSIHLSLGDTSPLYHSFQTAKPIFMNIISIFHNDLWRMDYFSHLMVRKLTFQRGKEICPESHSSQVTEHGFETRPLTPSPLLFPVSHGVCKLSFLWQVKAVHCGKERWHGGAVGCSPLTLLTWRKGTENLWNAEKLSYSQGEGARGLRKQI